MVIYVRQSVERDGSISPEVQERACRDYLAGRGDEVAEVIADVGVSGLKWDRRPGIQRAMSIIEGGGADGIVVWRWSRLSRKRLHQAVALDSVERAGGVIESATEPFDTATAGGRFGRDVMLAAAAFESQQKAEQWADAHRRRLDKGLPASGGRRFGYRIDDGRYVADPETAPILVECYRRYLAGQGVQQVADWLNAIGAPALRGDRWTRRGLAYMMSAGFAAGLIHQHKTGTYLQGAHEPLIDAETWSAFVAEMERRRTVAPRFLHPTWRLAGLVRCAHCGYAMTLRSVSGARSHVRCSQRDCTEKPLVNRNELEAAVVAWLPSVASEVTRIASSVPRAAVRTERDRIARTVAEADKALRALLIDKAREKVPAVVFDSAVAELTADRDRAQGLLDRAERERRGLDSAGQAAENLIAVWEDGDPAEVNAIARNLLWVSVSRLTWGGRHGGAEHEVTVRGVWERS